jgi:hypothetical protein
MDFFGEFTFGQLLRFEEAFNKKNTTYENTKVGGRSG